MRFPLQARRSREARIDERMDAQMDARRDARPVPIDSAALEATLISGGDARLALDAGGLNPYGCRPLPCADEISLSSSTASTISPRGYAAAGATFARLAEARVRGEVAVVFAQIADGIRDAIRRQL